MKIKCLDKFQPLITQAKPVKIIVGGRGSTKSTFVADRVACGMYNGERWACGREFQNSIEESVHMDLQREISRLSLPGFEVQNTKILHASGGYSFYVSLSRNILSLKGKLTGANMWIEEGEGLSEESIRIGFPSVRLSTEEAERLMEEYQRERGMTEMEAAQAIPKPEIWITMNRGSRNDPICKEYLSRAENSLQRYGYYEDDELLVVQANYTDVPKAWFVASGLEEKRKADEARLSPKVYRHKWHGEHLEEVENAIIKDEWFEACIDAHTKLGFEPEGFEVVAHDPSDEGDDPKSLAHRHGSVIKQVKEMTTGTVNDGMDWALKYALDNKVDHFEWDGDGLGLGLRQQAAQKLGGKRTIQYSMFRGGEIPEHPDEPYDPTGFTNDEEMKTNKELMLNKRAQYYRILADRMYNTYVAVKSNARFDPDKVISFSSEIECLDQLRAELVRLPLKKDSNKFQLMSKKEMKDKYGIASPNCADAVMMTLHPEPDLLSDWGDALDYPDNPMP